MVKRCNRWLEIQDFFVTVGVPAVRWHKIPYPRISACQLEAIKNGKLAGRNPGYF